MELTEEANVTTEIVATEANATVNQETVEESVDYIVLAVTKLTDELLNFKGGQMETVVHKEVAETLMKFCKQSAVFAEVVAKTPRTLSDCCVKVVEGADRSGISDIVAYRTAVKFYFPNSDIMFHMQIRHTGAAPSEEEIKRPAEKPKSTTNNQNRSAAVNNENTVTNTIHLDLFDDE